MSATIQATDLAAGHGARSLFSGLDLEVPEGARTSDLERLRTGPTTVSGKAMVAALDRVAPSLDGRVPKRVIVVPGRIVTVVV